MSHASAGSRHSRVTWSRDFAHAPAPTPPSGSRPSIQRSTRLSTRPRSDNGCGPTIEARIAAWRRIWSRTGPRSSACSTSSGFSAVPAGATFWPGRCLSIPVVTTLHTILARPTAARPGSSASSPLARRRSSHDQRTRALRPGAAVDGADDDRVAVVRTASRTSAASTAPACAQSRARWRQGDPDVRAARPVEGHRATILDTVHQIVDQVPDASVAVVGATHPEVRRQSGERYRDGLHELAGELGLANRVRFVDRYLGDSELAAWLVAADVFVTPYRDAQQMSSGTLAYALGRSSSHIDPLRTRLRAPPGWAWPPGSRSRTPTLSNAIASVLLDDQMREALRRRGREPGAPWCGRTWRSSTPGCSRGPWTRPRPLSTRWRTLRPHPPAAPTTAHAGHPAHRADATPAQTPVDLPLARRHLDELRTPIGIHQFASGRWPDPRDGSCTDDVARMLRVDHSARGGRARASVAAAIRHDLAVLGAAFNPARGRFRNFRAEDGTWLDEVGSEDAHGRAIHALGRPWPGATTGR